MAHRWTKSQTEYLQTLYNRYSQHQGRGRKLLANGRKGKLSERQYAILRFRQESRRHQTDWAWSNTDNLSDQAIWAKYQRINRGGVAANKYVAHNVKVANTFSDKTSGFTFISGFGSDASYDSWKTILRGLGMKRLGGGVSREVYALNDDYVIKIGFKAGARHNRDEANIWKKFGGTPDGEYLAKTVAVDTKGRWLVMERVEKDGFEGVSNSTRSAASRMNISDMHGGNVGTRKATGQQVIIDYACGL